MNIAKLAISIGVCFLAAFLGSLFTASSISGWYSQLNKPFFSPPNWVFGPVWTTLYLLMGISLYLVWVSKSKFRQNAIKLFFVQLGLNAIWSVIFFGMKNSTFALIDIVVLWIAIVFTIKIFYPISRLASYLLIPYIFWVSFASVLNLFIVLLN